MSAAHAIRVSGVLHALAAGVVADLPEIYNITFGGSASVHVIGPGREAVDAWLAYFDPAAKGEVTNPDFMSGKQRYAGRVGLAAGEVEFWAAVSKPTDEALRAENERLRAELAALRGEDPTPPGTGEAPAAEVAAEAAGAPDFNLGPIDEGCVFDAWGADWGVQAGARCLNDDPEHQRKQHPPAVEQGADADDLSIAMTDAEDERRAFVEGFQPAAPVPPEHPRGGGARLADYAFLAGKPAAPDADGDLIAPAEEA